MASSGSNLTPSIPPPPGHQPNFANPECDRDAVYIPLSICTGVATIFFFARAFTKRYVMKAIDIEDCKSNADDEEESRLTSILISLSLDGIQLFELGFQISAFTRLQCGLACHQWDLTAATVSCFHFRLYISNILYPACIIFIKLSILFQLKRIFTTPAKGATYWTIITLMWINTLFYSVWGIFLIFYCSPIQKSWDPTIPGHCYKLKYGLVLSPIVDFLLNVAMLLLPIWMLWRLEMKINLRLRAGTIFIFGILTCIASVLRIYYTVVNQESADVTWNYKGIAWATSLETGSGIVIASLPVILRLIRWLQDTSGTRTGSSGFSKSSRSSYSTKPRRLNSRSTDPPLLGHGLALIDRQSLDLQATGISRQDEQSKSAHVEERPARPIA